MSGQTNFERLETAGAVDSDDFNHAQVSKINTDLTSDEVTELIRIREKLGGGKMTPDDGEPGPDTTF